MLISIAEAALILGISKSSTYRLARDGKIPCVRSVGPLRVHEEMLLQQIKEEAERSVQVEAPESRPKPTAATKMSSPSSTASARELDRLLTVKRLPLGRARPDPEGR